MLATVDGTEADGPEAGAERAAYRRAAAVLAVFDADRLRPAGGGKPRPAAVQWLLRHCSPVFGPHDALGWALEHSVRRATLEQHVDRGGPEPVVERRGLQELRAANRPAFPTPLQDHLDAWIEGCGYDLEAMGAERLTALLRVLTWLPNGVAKVTAAEVEGRLDARAVLDPMEDLADGFQGRERSVGLLRDHVGVLDPSSTVRAWFRSIRGSAPLVVYGAGGVGKSTLIARFVLDHALLPEPRSFPFVYLDFDRPDFSARQPITLCAEAARQVGSCYPSYRSGFLALRKRWLEQAASSSGRRGRASAAALNQFAGLVAECAPDKPFLLVLDTFEEVQHRGRDAVRAAAQFVADLRRALENNGSRLRTVISGRSELTDHERKLFEAAERDQHRLENFDPLAARVLARASLEKLEVEDAERLAKELVEHIPGNPLTIKLAAHVIYREGLAAVADAARRARVFLSVRNDVLQGYLYERILGNLHSDSARKLANPGLAVRRVTLEVILEVLNEPCDLGIATLDEAEKLLDDLASEAALVRVARDGALEHRADVRRMALPLVSDHESERVRRIHENAVAFYRRRGDDLRARAEEIYHLLMLDAPPEIIEGRWLDGVEQHLDSALQDFQGRRREFLAARLTPSAVALGESAGSLDRASWERATAASARDLLASGQAKEALARLRGGPYEPESGALRRLEAESLMLLDRLDEAEAAARQAVECAIPDSSSRALMDSWWLMGRIALHRGEHARAEEAYETALGAAANVRDPLARVRCGAELLAMLRQRVAGRRHRAAVWRRIVSAYGEVISDLAADHPETLRSLAADVGDLEPGVLRNALDLIGVGRPAERVMEDLAQAMTSWDRAVSGDAGADGELAIYAELGGADSPTVERWFERLHQEGDRLGPWLARVIAEFEAHAPLVAVLRRLYERWDELQQVDSHLDSVTLTGEGRKVLHTALLRAFSRNELERLLRSSFGLSLDDIASPSSGDSELVFSVIKWAETSGRLGELIANARRERFWNWGFRRALSRALGEEAAGGQGEPADLLDRPSLDYRDPRVGELRKLLSEAYPTTERALTAARRSGVPQSEVPAGRSAHDTWRAILTAAAERGRLRDLVAEALDDSSIAGFHSAIRSIVDLEKEGNA